MAMGEKYCPESRFKNYEAEGGVISKLWERTKEVLGDRIKLMICSKNGNGHQDCHIVDVIMGSNVGIEIAWILRFLIPESHLKTNVRPIFCTDVITPFQMPVKFLEKKDNEKWQLKYNDPEENFLIENQDYLVLVKDEREVVGIYIYRK